MVHTVGIKGSNWSVSIGGFRDIYVDDVEDLLSRVRGSVSPNLFQLFDADKVAGWRHLFFAAVNAVKAFEAGTAISRSLPIEVLLYASCQDQISQAFNIIGLSEASERAALIVLAETPEAAEQAFKQASEILGTIDDSVLQVDIKKFEEIRRAFSVSALELEAVGGPREEALTLLLVERGALLPLQR